MTEISIPDLQAVGDVAASLAEQSDHLSAEQAIELLEAARRAQMSLKLAVDMLESRALAVIEQPILVGRTAWSKVSSFKKRPEQSRIDSHVFRACALTVDGEVVDSASDAVQAAIEAMKALYVSPSTVPKVGGARALGLELDDIVVLEHTGWELKRTELP